MIILGLNYDHESIACIVVNGELIAAIKEQHLNWNNHTTAFPHRAMDRYLNITKLSYSDIDHIALSIFQMMQFAVFFQQV